jgi:hypothetical protein
MQKLSRQGTAEGVGVLQIACEIRAITRFWLGMRLGCKFRAANRGHFVRFYFRDEAVAATRNSFYKARTFGGVAKSLADFVDPFIEPVVEIDKGVLRPEFFPKFLASYDLAGVLKQHRQELEGLFLKANSQAVPAQFASAKIQLENAKPERPAKLMSFFHGGGLV